MVSLISQASQLENRFALTHRSPSGMNSPHRTARRLLAPLIVVAACWAWPAERAAAQPCADIPAGACEVPLDWESPRGLAMALGGRANAASTSSLMYNPAGLVLGGAYHIEGLGDYYVDNGTAALGASITDSATSQLAGGFGIRGFLSGRDGYKGVDGRLGLAFPFSNAVSVGLAGRYLNVEREVELADGSVEDQELAEGFTMDAAFRFQPAEVLHVSLAAYNLVNLETPLVPIMVGVSAALTPLDELGINFDLLTDVSSFEDPAVSLGGGAEFLAAGAVPLRAGYSVDVERALHRLGLGIGYADKAVGIDLGVRHDVSGGDETRVMLGLRYHLQ